MKTYCANAMGRARLLASITSDGFFGFNQPDFKRVTRETRDIVEIKFPHQVGAVIVNGLNADSQFRGDFLGAMTFGNKLQNFAFTIRQKIRCAARVWIGDNIAQ